MLNAIAGVGMISVGTIGNPAIGAVQDTVLVAEIRAADPALAGRLVVTRPGLFGESLAVDPAERARLAEELAASEARVGSGSVPTDGAGELSRQAALLAALDSSTKQATLGRIALLPVIMLVCYVALIAYFRAAGGYRAERLLPQSVGSVARPR
jgi:hypothetical protein